MSGFVEAGVPSHGFGDRAMYLSACSPHLLC